MNFLLPAWPNSAFPKQKLMFTDFKYFVSGNLQLLHVLKAAWELSDGNYPGELSVLLLHLVWARSSITEASKCYFFFSSHGLFFV